MNMMAYVMVGTNDFDAALHFYDAVLGTIGMKRLAEFGPYAGYGPEAAKGEETQPPFWVCRPYDGQPASRGNGQMFAFSAPSRQSVHDFFDTVIAHGGSSEGDPGPRPDYGPDWYATYVRDRDGNKLACVCFAPVDH